MIVYGSSFSPFVRKLLAVAAEKQMEVENKPVNPNTDDPEFRQTSPFGKIPGFRDGDFAISDSSAIVAYLEAVKPEPAMIPAEARARARTVWFDEFADTILFPVFVKLFVNRVVTPKFRGQPGDQAAADAAERDELPPLLAYLERTVPDSGFLVEDRLTLADLAVASPFINIAHAGFDLAASPYPKTAAYVAGIVARPSFAVHVAKETAILAR